MNGMSWKSGDPPTDDKRWFSRISNTKLTALLNSSEWPWQRSSHPASSPVQTHSIQKSAGIPRNTRALPPKRDISCANIPGRRRRIARLSGSNRRLRFSPEEQRKETKRKILRIWIMQVLGTSWWFLFCFFMRYRPSYCSIPERNWLKKNWMQCHALINGSLPQQCRKTCCPCLTDLKVVIT